MYCYGNMYRSFRVFGSSRKFVLVWLTLTDTDFIADDQCLFIVWTLRENRMVNLWMGKLTGYKYWGHGGNLPFVSIQESTDQVPNISIIPIRVLLEQFLCCSQVHWCPASKQHSDQAHSLLLRVPKISIILRPSKQVCKILSSSSPFPIWDQQSLYEFL